jgi:hypothetical protein
MNPLVMTTLIFQSSTPPIAVAQFQNCHITGLFKAMWRNVYKSNGSVPARRRRERRRRQVSF